MAYQKISREEKANRWRINLENRYPGIVEKLISQKHNLSDLARDYHISRQRIHQIKSRLFDDITAPTPTVVWKNGNKNNWRRTQHNRIVNHLRKHPSECVVVYLAGEDDLDRKELLNRKFKPDNLIAVNRSQTIVQKLRNRGVLAIQGELTQVLASWKSKPRIDVLIADFNCGLERNILRFLRTLFHYECFSETFVLAINLRRGQEKTDIKLDQRLDQLQIVVRNEITEPGLNFSLDLLHRGHACLLRLHRNAGAAEYFSKHKARQDPKKDAKDFIEWEKNQGSTRSLKWFIECTEPEFYSYKNPAKKVYDSLVLRLPSRSFPGWLGNEKDNKYMKTIDLSAESDMARQIAAVKAHRTRRFNPGKRSENLIVKNAQTSIPIETSAQTITPAPESWPKRFLDITRRISASIFGKRGEVAS
jgi:hypothetical protein